MFLALDDLKSHLRVDLCVEDHYIYQCARAAEDYVSQYLNRPVPWKDDEGEDVPIPPAVKQATMMIASDLYHHREAQSIQLSENEAAHNLLHMYRTCLGV